MTYNPVLIGQKTMANSSPVVIASDQSSIPVTGTFWQATQPVSIAGTVAISASSLPLPTGAATESTLSTLNGKVTACNTGAVVLAAGAATIGALTANQTVDVAKINGVTPLMGNGVTGTGSLRVTLASDTTANSNPFLAVGNVAHDAADSGNPVKVGGKGRTTNPTAVADGDRTDLFTDTVGRSITVANQCRNLVGVQQTTITASTSETTIVTAVASTFLDLTHLSITNSSSTATLVTLKDSTGGTTRGIWSIAANGGIVLAFNTPLPQASVNTAWTLTCGTSVSSIYVVAQYVKNV